MLKPDSLAFALTHAARATRRVRMGTALPAALAAELAGAASLTSQARGATHDLAYHAMRTLGTVDALIAALVPKAPAEPVHDLLALSLSLLLTAETDADDGRKPGPRYAPYAVVSQAVEAAAQRTETCAAKGLMNAVLRRFLRERETLLAQIGVEPLARWNMPRWWIDALRRAWPDDWQAILCNAQIEPPMTLRVNLSKTTLLQARQRLAEHGIVSDVVGVQALRLAKPLPVQQIPGFAEGLLSVQDAGAQLAAPLLDAQDGMRVLDACAAPGGKTGHLLELANAEVVALESDALRAARIDDNLHRLGVQAHVQVGDAARPQDWWDGKPFDRILADVPCSASGIVRRHPDIRWLRRSTDIAALQAQQRRILDGLWPLLAPGGKLLYVTCSIFPEEGQSQADWFEAHHPDAVRLHSPGQLLPCSRPAEGNRPATDHDGFFYALFEKHAS